MLHRRAFNAMLAGTGLAITVTSVAHADEVEVAVDPSEAKFEPETIKIKVGDTVTWTNTQLVAHTVTFDPAKARHPESAILPAGVQPFDSGEMAQDQTFKHTFTVKGHYKYFCILHEDMKMFGFVDVA